MRNFLYSCSEDWVSEGRPTRRGTWWWWRELVARDGTEVARTHLGQVERSRVGSVVIVATRSKATVSYSGVARWLDALPTANATSCSRKGEARGRQLHDTHRSMWRTFLPSTESSPERTHSVRPVPRMILRETTMRLRREMGGKEGHEQERG